MNYETHPAALLFPMMAEEELNKLADDIAANGLLEPVVLYHGQIIDGRNRLEACKLAGVEPKYITVNGEIGQPVLYVVSKNLHRRHLSVGQRAAIAAEMVPMLREAAKHRQANSGPGQYGGKPLTENSTEAVKGEVREIAADAVGVSSYSVQSALNLKKSDPKAYEKVKAGEISVNSAARNSHKEPLKKDAPYEPKTDHQKKLAEGQKERMVRALPQITGLCRGLGEMDVRKAVAACYEEERTEWVERAKDLLLCA